MAKFKYNGNCSDMTAFGVVFRVEGENVENEVTDERSIGKLRNNSHFDEIGGGDVGKLQSDMTVKELKAYAYEKHGQELTGTKSVILDEVQRLDAFGFEDGIEE